jgi:hypothetical protein
VEAKQKMEDARIKARELILEGLVLLGANIEGAAYTKQLDNIRKVAIESLASVCESELSQPDTWPVTAIIQDLAGTARSLKARLEKLACENIRLRDAAANDAIGRTLRVRVLETLCSVGSSAVEDKENRSTDELVDNLRNAALFLHEENEKLKSVIAQHDLCHDLHGIVDCEGFAKGCAAEIKKHYGRCPWEEEIERLRNRLADAATPPDVPKKMDGRKSALYDLLVHTLNKVTPGGNFTNQENLGMDAMTELLCGHVLVNKQQEENFKEEIISLTAVPCGLFKPEDRSIAMKKPLRHHIHRLVSYVQHLHKKFTPLYQNDSTPDDGHKRSDYKSEKGALTDPEALKRLQDNCNHYWNYRIRWDDNKKDWKCDRCGLTSDTDPNGRPSSCHNLVLKRVGGQYVYACTKCPKELLQGQFHHLTNDCPGF